MCFPSQSSSISNFCISIFDIISCNINFHLFSTSLAKSYYFTKIYNLMHAYPKNNKVITPFISWNFYLYWIPFPKDFTNSNQWAILRLSIFCPFAIFDNFNRLKLETNTYAEIKSANLNLNVSWRRSLPLSYQSFTFKDFHKTIICAHLNFTFLKFLFSQKQICIYHKGCHIAVMH